MFVRFAIISIGILSVGILAPATQAGTIVQFNFNCSVDGANGLIDNFQVELFDNDAPVTVANFLQYVNNHLYDNTIIHRDVADFIMQGGGFTPVVESGTVTAFDPITAYGPIQNEFSVAHSNLRGMIAMAKLDSDPDSATSQWFVNLGDNSANLDDQNGGFTVFGQVLGEGMTLIDAIDNLPKHNLSTTYGGAFNKVPVFNNGTSLITITSATVVPEPSSLVLLSIAGLFLGSLVWRLHFLRNVSC